VKWVPILSTLLGVSVLCLGQDNSFIPFSFHGLCLRLLLLLCLFLWFLVGKDQPIWGRAWSVPLWWSWIGLLCFQALISLQSETIGFTLNFLEGRFWISLLILMLVDVLSFDDTKRFFKRCVGAVFIFGVIYGFYQIWVALPELRASLDMMEMDSNVYKERFMLRLNSDEMFGSRLYSNLFGLFALVGLFTCLPMRGQSVSKVSYVIIGLMLAGLYFSQSKGAVLAGLSVGVLWAFHWLRLKYNCHIGWLLLPLGLGVIGFILFKNQLHASIQIRLDYWQVSLEILKAHPIGIGALNFSEYYGSYMHAEATEVKMAHNDHLQFFCEFGYLGGVLHFLFLGHILFLSFKQSKLHETGTKEIAFTKLEIFGFLVFAFYLILSCVSMRMGPWDLPIHGVPFITFCLGVLYVVNKNRLFDSNQWVVWGILLMMVHGFIDMPFYDHSLLGVVLVAFFCEIGKVEPQQKLGKLPFYISTVVFLGLAILGLQRYQHLLISDWMSQTTEWKKEEVDRQVQAYTFDHQSIEPIYRRWRKEGEPVIGSIENEFLKELLTTRPMHSTFALSHAKKLDPKSESENWYRKAYQHHITQPRYAFHLGEYLYRTGRTKEGLEYIRKALERHDEAKKLSEGNSDFLLHLLQPEQFQKARELIQD